jgi:hypothetical protein
MHFATVETGITEVAPLNKAVVMVDVARSTSMITTTLLVMSYKSINAGDRQVYKFLLLDSIRVYFTNGN